MTGLLLSALGAATGGAVVVFLAHKLLKAKEPWESVVRDLGIALIVAALVTVGYESYARSRYDLDRISALLDTVYGSGVSATTWNSIKRTLLQREVSRTNMVMRLRLAPYAEADMSRLELDLDLTYDLGNLQPTERAGYLIVHELDRHITDPERTLPRFRSFSIDGKRRNLVSPGTVPSAEPSGFVNDGRLTVPVHLAPAPEGRRVRVGVRRTEFRSCPDSYFFIMTELTEGVHVYLDECPPGVRVQVRVRPTEDEIDLNEAAEFVVAEPMLPGHALEFKLTPTVLATSSPAR